MTDDVTPEQLREMADEIGIPRVCAALRSAAAQLEQLKAECRDWAVVNDQRGAERDALAKKLAEAEKATAKEKGRADEWVTWARDQARAMGVADEDSGGSIIDARTISYHAKEYLKCHVEKEKAEARAVAAEQDARNLRSTFHYIMVGWSEGHPGEPCFQSSWIQARFYLAAMELLYPAAPSAEVAKPAWIASADKMPPHGKCLAWDSGCKRIRLMEWYAKSVPHRWYDEEDNQFHGDISHWQPLPESPVKPAAQTGDRP